MRCRMWFLAQALLVPALLVPGIVLAAGIPEVGAENVIDPGFRYLRPATNITNCAVAVADSVALLAYSNDRPRVEGYRRGPGGREIDVNATNLHPADRIAGPFDLSSYDGSGWKMAYLSQSDYLPGWGSLWLRNLDRQTLQATGPDLCVVRDEANALDYPVLAWTGGRHLLAWIDGPPDARSLHLIRVLPNLTLEDGRPVYGALCGRGGPVALAADSRGGILMWQDRAFAVRVQNLDGSGMPVGEARVLHAYARQEVASLDVCRIGDGWFAAWVDRAGVSFARLDPEGTILPPGIGSLTPGTGWITSIAASPIAPAPEGDRVVLAWRNVSSGTVSATRLVPGPERWMADSSTLATSMPYDNSYAHESIRNLDCAWTGRELVVLWSTAVPTPVGARDARGAGSEPAGPSAGITEEIDPFACPVYARWLSADGQALGSNPVLVNQESRPTACGVHFGDGRFFSLVQDDVTPLYIHGRDLDGNGRPEGAPWRNRTLARPSQGEWDSWETWDIGHINVRSGRATALVKYGYVDWKSEHDLSETRIVVDLVNPDGTLATTRSALVDAAGGSWIRKPTTCDAALGTETFLIAYGVPRTREYLSPLDVRAVLQDSAGRPLESWVVRSPYSCTIPKVAAMGDRYLLVWLEGAPEPRLCRAILDPNTPSGTIAGEILAPSLGPQTDVSLIEGDNQVLCVLTAEPPPLARADGGVAAAGATNVYTLRFDRELHPMDAKPIPLSASVGNQGNVSGIWDGRQYLVTWANLDPGMEAIFGARVAAGGALRDSIPFLIAPGFKNQAFAASDGQGTIMVAYAENRVRAIHDSSPLIWQPGGEPPPDDPPDDPPHDPPHDPPDGSDAPVSLRIGVVQPNPTRGEAHWDLDLPSSVRATIEVFDATGRCVRTVAIEGGPGHDGWTWDGRRSDGRPAPAGCYFLRIQARDRSEIRSVTLVR